MFVRCSGALGFLSFEVVGTVLQVRLGALHALLLHAGGGRSGAAGRAPVLLRRRRRDAAREAAGVRNPKS